MCGGWLVTPTGFEPVAPRLGIWCSILLSYGVTAVFLGFRPFDRNPFAERYGAGGHKVAFRGHNFGHNHSPSVLFTLPGCMSLKVPQLCRITDTP